MNAAMAFRKMGTTIRIQIKAGVPEEMAEDDRPSFEEWMSRIDRMLIRYRGISLYDLEDCPYRDWYEERIRPIYAANKALKRAGARYFED